MNSQDLIKQVQDIQDQINALHEQADQKEAEAQELRKKAVDLAQSVKMATDAIRIFDAERQELRNEMESKINNMYMDVLTNPDPSGFRRHIEEFASTFSFTLAEEEKEAESNAA